MTPSTEVDFTTRGSSRLIKTVVVLSIVGIAVGMGFVLASSPEWWAALILLIIALVMAVLLLGLFFAVGDSARQTDALRRTGVETRTDVVSATIEDWHEDTVYELVLDIRPSTGESFTATHRCTKARCRETAAAAPTTITALVDASTRTWAVIH